MCVCVCVSALACAVGMCVNVHGHYTSSCRYVEAKNYIQKGNAFAAQCVCMQRC